MKMSFAPASGPGEDARILHGNVDAGAGPCDRAKVDAARAQVASGDVASNAAVEERLVSRRAELRAKVERR
jgi:hypothetical protein